MDLGAIGHYIVINNGMLVDRVSVVVLGLLWFQQRSMRRRLHDLERKVYGIPGDGGEGE